MDSLLASYASSDEEEEEEEAYQQKQSHEPSSSKTAQPSSLSFFLPKPKSLSSSTFSLPPPKSSSVGTFSLPPPKSSSSGIFSLPPPKSSSSGISSGFSSLPLPESNNPTPTLPSSDPSRKRVVQFKPPINPSLLKPPEEDDDDEEEDRKPIKGRTSSTETSSVKSFFSSLPAPKNSLGLGSGSAPSLGAGRKSIVETLEPVTNFDGVQSNDNGVQVPSKFGERGSSQQENLVDESSLEVENLTSGSDASNWEQGNEVYGSYGYDGGYGNYGGSYGTYDGSTAVGINSGAAESSGMVESFMRKQGKRGRSEIPTEIVEVKQDELMKNRPREDQVKTTGIAFGPAYQPVSTAKGKPTKLHKRKHQIGTLYHDMKSKEMELNERRAKGFLTKAETQAKYGW